MHNGLCYVSTARCAVAGGVRRALQAGVRIAMGTDQGTPANKPGENAQELLQMTALGMSSGAALMAATAWAAGLLRVGGEAGSISGGLAADLVVLDGDPLENIGVLTNQRAIRAVIQAGRIVRSDLPENED